GGFGRDLGGFWGRSKGILGRLLGGLGYFGGILWDLGYFGGILWDFGVQRGSLTRLPRPQPTLGVAPPGRALLFVVGLGDLGGPSGVWGVLGGDLGEIWGGLGGSGGNLGEIWGVAGGLGRDLGGFWGGSKGILGRLLGGLGDLGDFGGILGDFGVQSRLPRPQPTLGVAPPGRALLFVVLCPVGPYFPGGLFAPVRLLADPRHVRAWPGGAGHCKLGGNYGPCLELQEAARARGCQQVLWLHGPECHLTEVGTMNLFVFWERPDGGLELVTPPLDGLILPGVTRQSLLELARSWGEFEVREASLPMSSVLGALREGRLREMFGAGTACVVCPVGGILYQDELHPVPTMENGPKVASRFLQELSDIQVTFGGGSPGRGGPGGQVWGKFRGNLGENGKGKFGVGSRWDFGGEGPGFGRGPEFDSESWRGNLGGMGKGR
uniref:Branched-chain-amino-acid aminotransferase n=1 Tax=Corvus moneduloides TaxID=1196302 RepID=A0A8U7NDW3_CORMO